MPSPLLLLHLFLELAARELPERVPEPALLMDDALQADAYAKQGQEVGFLAPLHLYHAIQASALIRPGDHVLDLACGPGSQLHQLARLNPRSRFLGVDAAQQMLVLAERIRTSERLDNVDYQQGNMLALQGFADQRFDVVTCTMSFHHLPDTQALAATCREIRRVLRPGGRVYLADFGRLKRIQTQRYLAGQNRRSQPAVFREDYFNSLRAAFSLDELSEAALALGLPVAVKHTHGVPLFVAMISQGFATLDPAQQTLARHGYAQLHWGQRRNFRDIARFFWQGGYPLAFRPW